MFEIPYQTIYLRSYLLPKYLAPLNLNKFKIIHLLIHQFHNQKDLVKYYYIFKEFDLFQDHFHKKIQYF